jgi:hypothetical protein
MDMQLDGAEMWKLNEYDIARISMPNEGITYLLANKDIKTGTILSSSTHRDTRGKDKDRRHTKLHVHRSAEAELTKLGWKT